MIVIVQYAAHTNIILVIWVKSKIDFWLISITRLVPAMSPSIGLHLGGSGALIP